MTKVLDVTPSRAKLPQARLVDMVQAERVRIAIRTGSHPSKVSRARAWVAIAKRAAQKDEEVLTWQ